MLEQLAGHESRRSSASNIADDLTGFGKRFTSMLVNVARVCPPEYISLLHPIVSPLNSCRLLAMSRAPGAVLQHALAPPDLWASTPP